MCGIVGFSGSFDTALLSVALRKLAHRGPDDTGLFLDKSIGLGHVRLSILDLSSSGHQPMINTDSTVVLVFNGEIYNYRELRAELEADGVCFRGQSDTEVLLALYLREGLAMFPRLNGIFAFTIWDGRNRELLLARDALGVKPLYFTESSQGFAFASEIKALLEFVPHDRSLDYEALHRYLTFLWCPGEGTPLKSVRKLLPGEALLVREGRITRRWSWYKLPMFREIVDDMSKEEALSGTITHLRQAVHSQMVADVPVGAFLSGGLDSSAVVAFAREQNSEISCFTIESTGGQEEGIVDDLPYARSVARHLGVELNVISIDAGKMADDLERMVIQLDEPLADPAPLNVLYISQLAREHGIKVLLSGVGGDDLFTGYRRHYAVQLERYWNWLPQTVKGTIECVTTGLDHRSTFNRRLSKLFNGLGLSKDERIVNYFRWIREADLKLLYTPEFLSQLDNSDAASPMLEFLRPLHGNVSSLEKMLALEQRFFLADHNLSYTDKMSMAVGVEVRVPFLDLDLVDFAARIPTNLKQRGWVGKWVLKKAFEYK